MKIWAHLIKMMSKICQPACEPPPPLRLLHLPFRLEYMDYRKIKHRDAGPLGIYPILSVLPDNLPGFCLSFILFGLKASTSHHCPPTAVTSMRMALLKMIRWKQNYMCKGIYYTYYDTYMYYIYYFGF